MKAVAVIGIGKTAFGALADRDLRSLAVEAGEKCLSDAHVSASQVEAFYLSATSAGPSFVGQNHLAPYVASGDRDQRRPLHPVRGRLPLPAAPLFSTRFRASLAGLYDLVLVGQAWKR